MFSRARCIPHGVRIADPFAERRLRAVRLALISPNTANTSLAPG